MKIFGNLIIFMIFSFSIVFAFEGQEVCEDPIEQTDELLICSKAAYKIMHGANKWSNIKKVSFALIDHLYLGYPDDSTDVNYSYLNQIKTLKGKITGYSNIFGISNSEGEWSVQITVYYSTKGEVLGATSKYLEY